MLVVLIDDDRDDGEIFGEALRELFPRIQFRHWEDPKAAIQELSQKNSPVPDLIFLDINMPVMNGWECLQEFGRIPVLKEVPVYIYTTSSQLHEKQTAEDAGAAGFFTKPDDYTALKQMLQSVLDGASFSNASSK